jgi:hypothetical protein
VKERRLQSLFGEGGHAWADDDYYYYYYDDDGGGGGRS